MLVKCTNPICQREWDYQGKKTYPAYVGCPDCMRRIQLPEESEKP